MHLRNCLRAFSSLPASPRRAPAPRTRYDSSRVFAVYATRRCTSPELPYGLPALLILRTQKLIAKVLLKKHVRITLKRQRNGRIRPGQLSGYVSVCIELACWCGSSARAIARSKFDLPQLLGPTSRLRPSPTTKVGILPTLSTTYERKFLDGNLSKFHSTFLLSARQLTYFGLPGRICI